MKCDRYREAASAQMDGEPLGMPTAVLDAHMATCRQCSSWLATVNALNRTVRVTAVEIPDLSAQILHSAALPAGRLLRLRALLQVALFVTAAVQLGLSVPELFGHGIGMSMGAHMSHESGAFNIAIGVGLLAVALRPARVSGLLPVVTALVGLLGVLGIPDLLAGRVEPSRLATHLTLVAGLGLLFTMWRYVPDGPLLGASAGHDDTEKPGMVGVSASSGRSAA